MNQELDLPRDLKHILEDEGFYEDETFDPILITVTETEFGGRNTTNFQLEFPAWEQIGPLTKSLKERSIKLDGYAWENLIRQYLKTKNAKLEQAVQGDSEGETCVLYTHSKARFEALFNQLQQMLHHPDEVRELLQSAAFRST